MKRRIYNLVRLIVLLAMFAQAVVPARAFSEVSVRCAGASPASAPCMRAVLALSSATPAQIRCSQMACCRSKASLMRACGMAASPSISHAASPSHLHAAACLITIKPLRGALPAYVSGAKRWMLDAAPACAPPAPRISVSHPMTVRVDAPRPRSVSYFPPASVRPHALRAPPVF